MLPSLARDEWTSLKRAHIKRVKPWTTDRVARATVGTRHPVFDFLFTYYSFRPAHLERWSPGAGVILEQGTLSDVDWVDDFVETPGGVVIPAESFPQHRAQYISWAIRYLTGISQRQPSFCCFGLHEWAMLYGTNSPRHEQVPLRLSSREIDRVVEGAELRCTHYDAFRFFTPAALPLNRTALTRQATSSFDQRGCIHVTMDLYKFAFKIAPWCPSELVAEAFLLAADARTIDMRASPYDLRAYGFEPIQIESSEGREEYVQEQRRLAERASPIRDRLLIVYQALARSHNR